MDTKEQIQKALKKYLQKAKEWTSQAAKEAWSFLSSPVFLKNISLLLATALLLIFLTSRWLSCYTRHGKAIPVPDLKGLDLDEAIQAAADNSLEIVVRDSIWIKGQEGRIVLEQEPPPAAYVKPNRKIYLRISRSVPEEVPLPELKGSYNFEQYRRRLRQRQLDLTTKERVYHPQHAENTILYLIYEGQKIDENDLKKGVIKVPKGSVIEAVVTRRTAEDFTNIPNLICSTLQEAQFVLHANKLKLGEIIKDASVHDEETAVIWKQSPPYTPEGHLQKGTSIKVYLTQEPPESCQ